MRLLQLIQPRFLRSEFSSAGQGIRDRPGKRSPALRLLRHFGITQYTNKGVLQLANFQIPRPVSHRQE
jgi:hypothetical protein